MGLIESLRRCCIQMTKVMICWIQRLGTSDDTRLSRSIPVPQLLRCLMLDFFALLDFGTNSNSSIQLILAQGSTMGIRWRGNANLCNLDSFSWLCEQENWQPQHGTHWALDCDVLRPLTYSKVQEAVSASPRSVCARSPINSRKARSNASSDVWNPFRAIRNKATNMLLRVAFLSSCLNFWGPHYWNDNKCKLR